MPRAGAKLGRFNWPTAVMTMGNSSLFDVPPETIVAFHVLLSLFQCSDDTSVENSIFEMMLWRSATSRAYFQISARLEK